MDTQVIPLSDGRRPCEHPETHKYVYRRKDGWLEKRCRTCRAIYQRAYRKSWGLGS